MRWWHGSIGFAVLWPVLAAEAPPPVPDPIHWAYLPPVRPPLPPVGDASWPLNEIDRFVLARLEREGRRPSPAAERRTLLRRLWLDLVGLPPPVEAQDAFLADAAPGAVERVVDRLLDSPQFGERWARPWLDLARYADSHGFQRDDLREVWAYRDWVIRVLNADLPFDRFTIEQLAGDLLPGASEAQRIATGFHRCAPTNVEAGSDPEETRVNQVFDRVNTTATVWLGTTLECAQCHDHKYDPFTQRDYFGLFAFFNGTSIEAERARPEVPGSIRFVGPSMALSDDVDRPGRRRIQEELDRVDGRRRERRRELQEGLEFWARDLAAAHRHAPRAHVLPIADFDSAGGSPYTILPDRSVLLTDDPPDRDTYTVTVHTELTGITGFRLEALLDPSLPGEGPGRGDAQRPNFVLHEFSVTEAPRGGGPARAVPLRRARASFSQKGYDIAGAIDADPRTAWAIAPRFHEPQWAAFETDLPRGEAAGTTLVFTLEQTFGSGRTIGRLRLSALTGPAGGEALPAPLAAALSLPPEARTPEQGGLLLDTRLQRDPEGAALSEERDRLERGLKQLAVPTTLVMQELPQPRPTFRFKRGDFRAPLEAVAPGAPAALLPLPEGPPTRLTLARWLVDRRHPLTARVTVNRAWAELFGRGIVATPEDFGRRGEPPTHPELLDWLAVEFMDRGWSFKRLLRTIVTSATYRQSSRATPAERARDPLNQQLGRGPRLRLDAETIRDNALAASGLLNLKPFGPPIRPPQPDGLWTKIGGARVEYVVSPGEERHRRGIYVVWKRASAYPSFVAFDAPARLTCTVRRTPSNTPLQALVLLNDPVYVEAAAALAGRLLKESAKGDDRARLTLGFHLCVARDPEPGELDTLERLLLEQRAADPGDESAAWGSVAAALLNLDETITKE